MTVSVEIKEFQLLQAVAEAASDLKLATRDAAFARKNGGVKNVRAELFIKVSAWEDWSTENGDDSSCV